MSTNSDGWFDLLEHLSLATTVLDASMELSKGRRKSGAALLGAAALSSRIPGLGTAISVLIRLFRRLR